MRKTAVLMASMAVAVVVASGLAVAQTAPPEHPYYEFAGKWSVDDGPQAIDIDSQGNIYVLASGVDLVQKFTPEGTLVREWTVPCTYYGGIAVDSRDRIYVTSSDGGNACRDIARVQKFTSNGTLLTQWGTPGTGDNQFRSPEGVAVDSQDNVYVIDSGVGNVKKYTSEGTFITKWGSPGDGEGEFYLPEDIAIDSQDNVYVLESGVERVQKFTSDGTFVKTWGGFSYPLGIATDSRDNVYVSDHFGDSVERFTPEGELVTEWGSDGEANGQFNGPWDVAVDSRGFAYVADFWNNRIQKFAEVDDTIAPDSRVSFSPSLNKFGRINQDTRVLLSATDVGVGAKEITYEATGAQLIDPTTVSGSTAQFPLSAEGRTTISFFATDKAGNTEQPPENVVVWVDKTAPQVENTMPETNASGVARDAVVEAFFTEAMDPSKINAPNLRKPPRVRLYEKGSSTPVAATVSYDAQAKKATLTPEALLKAGMTYRAVVLPAATDLAYNPLDQNPSVEGNQAKVWRFSVRG